MLSVADLDVAETDFVKPWSGGNGGNCLEVAFKPLGIAVRDSKMEGLPSPVLTFRQEAAVAFAGGLALDSFAFADAA